MRKRILKIKGRRIVLCWVRGMIRNDQEAEQRAQAVVATLPDNETYWGGFGRGPFLVVVEA